MRRGVGELNFEVDGERAFARVTVEIADLEGPPGHHLSIAEPGDGRHFFFLDSARAGVRYGLARLGRALPMSLKVTITDIQTVLSDTNEMMVIYAAAQAVWNAQGQYPSITPVVDETNRLMTFHF